MATMEFEMSVEEIVQSLKMVARKIGKLEGAREEHLKSTHGRFNLFTVLLKAHDEVRVHGRYLTHLLDPQGSHDCGRLFLDSFLEEVGLSELIKQDCCCVKNELYVGRVRGRESYIDIYLEFKDAIVVIENKIWAGDQPEQLYRYASSAEKTGKPSFLFYLTLDGHPPLKNSLGGLREDKVALVSYEKNILSWVERCLRETDSFVNINQALLQYKLVVNNLVGNTLEAQDMKEIKKLILENDEILKHEKQILAAFKEIHRDRELEIQKTCQEILGSDVNSWIEYWGGIGTAFKFSSNRWGDSPRWGNKGDTDLTVLMNSDGSFSLIAYDCADGEVKAVIDQLHSANWEVEKSYLKSVYIQNILFSDALIALEKVVCRLDEKAIKGK